ncbi:CoA transferase (plasmid) [Sphingomonas paeninsulae]|uniref:CoA transferase n=2 Tax=Sphingomonas paeninsulae TaxID=2319844 RepID=A0A494THY5_SPHPE|nr:CoA transferase [Sphingomonas paeninsulae]
MAGGALEGIRVVDLTSVVVGPVATMFLADYGADVIKVEAPGGDLLRKLGGASKSGQLSPKFLHFNRNKRSIVLDLKQAESMAALRRLLETADVCVSNMRPKAMAKLGLSIEGLREINPAMIYCGLVGFGQGGRYRSKPAYDGIIQGAGGLTAIFEKSDGEPRFVPMTIADHTVGLIASQMITLALYKRQMTGASDAIEVPMFENMAAFVLSEHMGQLSFDPPRGEPGDLRVLDAGAKPVATKDGHICISANTDAQAFAMFRAIGQPDLCVDARFNSVKARYDNVSAYFALRESALLNKTTSEWIEIFDEADVPAGPSHTLESLFHDEHLNDVGLFQTRIHPTEGGIVDITLPNKSQALARTNYMLPPLQGEHTREILTELGYTAADIDSTFVSGSVAEPYAPVTKDTLKHA